MWSNHREARLWLVGQTETNARLIGGNSSQRLDGSKPIRATHNQIHMLRRSSSCVRIQGDAASLAIWDTGLPEHSDGLFVGLQNIRMNHRFGLKQNGCTHRLRRLWAAHIFVTTSEFYG